MRLLFSCIFGECVLWPFVFVFAGLCIEALKLYGFLWEVLLFGSEAENGFITLQSVESTSEPGKVPRVPSEEVYVLLFLGHHGVA